MNARALVSRLVEAGSEPHVYGSLTPARLLRPVLSFALVVLTLSATVFCFRVLNDGMEHAGFGGDEGYFTWCGWSILKGRIPYVDFLEFKPPILFLTHALSLAVYGFEGLAFRQLFGQLALGSILALQLALLTRGVDKFLAMALAVAIVRTWVNPHFHDTALTDSESVGIAYFLFGLACFLARTPFDRTMQVIGGVFFSCAILSKEPFLPPVVLVWASCFLLNERKVKELRPAAIAYLKYSALGAAIVALGLVLYMAPTGALKAYVTVVGRYTRVYRDPAQSFCVLGGAFEPTTPLNDFFRFLKRSLADFLTMDNLGALVPFGAAFLAYCGRRSVPLAIAGWACCALGLYVVNASNCPWFHYFNLAFTGLFFASIAGLDSMTPYFRAMDGGSRALVRFFVVALVALATWPMFDKALASYKHHTSPVPSDSIGAEFIRTHTQPDDYVFTSGNPALYVLTGRRNAVREGVMLDPMLPFYVGDTDEEKLRPVRDELVKHRPKVVVLDPEFANRKVRHDKALFEPFLREFNYTEARPHIFVRPD